MKLKREGTPKQDINMKKLFRRNQIIDLQRWPS